ncbi:type I polyketide synthase [Shimia thalassica]|uniref:type I polyketide synthase n=1 Tax=Shimia thalassica TaxID=1715693 RepID=UPI0026E43007|nr:type I polyketide synthase [Shimia thalassica]MDO6485510.1 SDR family NAD(P)-dependent oxidoreductase [Shimia thalassica]
MVELDPVSTEDDIAIVGMAAHLPGADGIDAYWANLRDGIESIRSLSQSELEEAGESPSRMRHKNYVPSAAILEDFEKFDADFFGLSPKEAAIMDPQHRQFLEVSWEALENAAHPPESFNGPIGVFAGCGMGSYFYFNICSNPELVQNTGMFLLRHTGNDKDFLSTRLSHILNLTGPSLGLQTACSTSLVAVHYAAQSLLNGECDMAVAGGVTIELPHARGYIFEEGEILSPDGHCHAFDHRAQGTVFGSGAGAVVLRRLSDAIADGDHIWAVVKGSNVNNDGSAKAGYLAPSVDGQAEAIANAHALAGISAETIDYVECHGTGTYLGDPIEVAALTEAFRETTDDAGFCRIGSVKTNIGHLDTAAGAASLIKTALSLHHKQMAPTLGYEKPNPAIDFETSPFKVNDTLTDWVSHKGPRRAGVNSLGVGGTNAHVVLEEAPERPPSQEADWPFFPLVISGRTNKALDANAARLAAHLRENPDQPLADVAFTLKEGRRAFEKRRVIVAETHEEAAELLETNNPRRVFNHTADIDKPELVFMFPGGGAQYVGMARDLYETEPTFMEWMDRGFAYLETHSDEDLRALWLAEGEEAARAATVFARPSAQLPLIMMVEYALAQLWISWGVAPAVLVGHSMGENTAAALAGVMSFEDCLGLVLLRGQLFDTVAPGGMLSVPLPLAEVQTYLDDRHDIASVNAPALTVISGPDQALQDLASKLALEEIETQRINIDIAAHSAMLEPILDRFRSYLSSINLNAPNLPIVSNLTGAILKEEDAMSPDYWVAHLRNTVMFSDDISTLSQEKNRVYLEVGPGKALSSLTRMNGQVPNDKILSSLRHPDEELADDLFFLQVLGQLWACGVDVDWGQIWGDVPRQRVVLPTYAFQRSSYFIEPGSAVMATPEADLMREEDRAKWSYVPSWTPQYAACDLDVTSELHLAEKHSWLIFEDESGIGSNIAEKLRNAGHDVISVASGDKFGKIDGNRYVLAPERGRDGYDALVRDLMTAGVAPDRVVHMWLCTRAETYRPGSSFFHRNQEQGLFSLFFLAQAMADENLPMPIHSTVISSGALQVRDEPLPYPEKATVLGAVQVIPREMPGLTCGLIDLDPSETNADTVLEDLLAPPRNAIVAYRSGKRFERGYRQQPLSSEEAVLKKGATYLITGGFGGIGLTVAERMVRTNGANVVLLGREALPAREDWAGYLAGHGPADRTARKIRAVERLESLGGKVLSVAGDVCNIDDMQRVLSEAEQAFGKIDGVVHAAGVIDDAPFMTKTSANVDDVLAPKLHGTQVLETIFPDGSLDWLVLFSSSSTATAPAGQIDYVAANAYLNAYAQSRQGDKTRVVAINWGIWSDVGMAADAVAAISGVQAPSERQQTNAALLDTSGFDADGHRVFFATLSPETHWVLSEHRTKEGEAVFPGTGYLEVLSEAWTAQGEAGPFEIRDLTFLRALPVVDNATEELRVRMMRTDEGYKVEFHTECLFEGQKAYQLHAEARLLPLSPNKPATETVPADLQGLETGPALVSPQEAHLNFGPRWKVLQKTTTSGTAGFARLHLDDAFAPDLGEGGFALHPGLLDLATGWAMSLIPGYGAAHLWVPVSYGQVKTWETLPQDLVSHVHLVDGSAETGIASFDVTLMDMSGNVCVKVHGLTIKKVETSAGFAAAPALRRNEVEFEAGSSDRPMSAAEERLAHNLSQGIPSQDGADLFEAALGSGRSQVIMSSLDLEALIAQAAQGADESSVVHDGFERPELETDFVAPSNDIERTLAGFWQELLGVSEVGTQDSFFDLGGHSLIAVRLFAMVKKAYRIEFPISILFEAPTIAKCAELIAERVGPQEEGQTSADVARPEETERRFTHLVPMHSGEGGSRTPFFLVAGMFGNVLNLRHLAHLLGADRPFYGLQARGLYGDADPHEDLIEAARDYIAEMRQVQPKGPYLLGGFSGGGITAFEIAHQLEAAGEEVALIALLDTPLPVRRALSFEDRMRIQMQELRSGGLAYPAKWLQNRIRWEMEKRRTPDVGEDTQTADTQFHNEEIEAAFLRAVESYPMRPWTGRMSLFRPPLAGKWDMGDGRMVDHQRAYVFHDNDWGQFVPGIEVVEVPGDHDSMVLEPNVRVLAARMKRAIETAERDITLAARQEAAE